MLLEPQVVPPAAAVLVAELGRIIAHIIFPGNHPSYEFGSLVDDEPFRNPAISNLILKPGQEILLSLDMMILASVSFQMLRILSTHTGSMSRPARRDSRGSVRRHTSRCGLGHRNCQGRDHSRCGYLATIIASSPIGATES